MEVLYMTAETRKTLPIALAGIAIVIAIMIFGTLWTGRKAQKDTSGVA